MPILYIETNFLMSIATGREEEADNLLATTPPSVQIAIPSICCMEAVSAFEDERKRRNRFTGELENQISQLERDLTSPYASSLLSLLRQSRIENKELLNDIERRLFNAIAQLATKAEMIALTPEILQESLNATLLPKDPTDRLILHSILNHARLRSTEVKAFLSGNTKEFDNLEVRNVLREAGVEKYFARTRDFLSWLQSQPTG